MVMNFVNDKQQFLDGRAKMGEIGLKVVSQQLLPTFKMNSQIK